MKRTELIIFILTLLLCSTVMATSAIDKTLTVRNLIWSVSSLVLLISISTRYYKQQIDIDFVFNPIFSLIECLVLLSLISCFYAVNFGEAFYGVCKLIGMVVGLFVTTVIIKEHKKAVFIFLSVLPLVIIPYSIYRAGTIYSDGLMANRNLWSSALFLLIPFCVYTYKEYKFKLSVLSVILIVAQMYILFTRSALLALFVFGLVLFLAKNRLRNTLILGVVTLMVGIIIFFTPRWSDLKSTKTMNWRKYLWFNTLRMSLDKPFGVGINNWRLVIPDYPSEALYDFPDNKRPFKEMWFVRPHNEYLAMLSEMGIAGLAIYLALFGFTILYLKDRILIAGLLGYMTIAFFSFPTERVFHTMILLIFMGIALSNHETIRISFAKQNFYPFSIVLTLMIVVCIYVFGVRYQTERRLLGIRYLRNQMNDWQAIYEKTKSYSFLSTLHPNTVPIEFYQGESNYMLGRHNESFNNFKKALTQNPHDVKTLLNLSACYKTIGEFDKAKEMCEHALKICPTDKAVLNNLEVIKESIKTKGN